MESNYDESTINDTGQIKCGVSGFLNFETSVFEGTESIYSGPYYDNNSSDLQNSTSKISKIEKNAGHSTGGGSEITNPFPTQNLSGSNRSGQKQAYQKTVPGGESQKLLKSE